MHTRDDENRTEDRKWSNYYELQLIFNPNEVQTAVTGDKLYEYYIQGQRGIWGYLRIINKEFDASVNRPRFVFANKQTLG